VFRSGSGWLVSNIKQSFSRRASGPGWCREPLLYPLTYGAPVTRPPRELELVALRVPPWSPDHGRPRVGPPMMQNTGPTGRSARALSHGRRCSQHHSSMPTSRRRPPFPLQTGCPPEHRPAPQTAGGRAERAPRRARGRSPARGATHERKGPLVAVADGGDNPSSSLAIGPNHCGGLDVTTGRRRIATWAGPSGTSWRELLSTTKPWRS
jgi:hypothetical protein